MKPAAWALLSGAVLVVSAAAESSGGPPMPERAGDMCAGLALLGGGALASARRPSAGAGPLMVVAGILWFAGALTSSLLYAHRGPLVHLLLAYPGVRTSSPLALLVITAAYAGGLIPDVARSEWATLALVGAVLLVAAWRHVAAAGAERRARAAALAGAALLSLGLGVPALMRLLDGNGTAALWVLYGAVVALACGLTADLLWGRWARAALTRFVIDLGDQHEPHALRAALARTLGDPDLQLAYRVAGQAGWVDEGGRPMRLPDGGGRRAVTLIGDPQAPVAAVVHEPTVLSDPGVLTAVAAAARLAIANVRLQADISGRVRDVAASRRRLVEAGDEERRRLAEQLQQGPEKRLAEVATRLQRVGGEAGGEVAATLGRLSDDMAATREQLHQFAQGVRPRTLSDAGLGAALRELAQQSSVPVEVSCPDSRSEPALELAAYFVCSEALANLVKHARASQARVTVVASKDELKVAVADDGVGGARAASGSGLQGLADRVEALGGRLQLESPRGAGTRLEASLPKTRGGAP